MKMLRMFVLDDEIYKNPRRELLSVLEGHDLTIATSCGEAKSLYKGPYDVWFLDHDMRGFIDTSDYHNTGYQFLKWLLPQMGQREARPFVFLHSQNTYGRENMAQLMKLHNFQHVVQCPFSHGYVRMVKQTYG